MAGYSVRRGPTVKGERTLRIAADALYTPAEAMDLATEILRAAQEQILLQADDARRRIEQLEEALWLAARGAER